MESGRSVCAAAAPVSWLERKTIADMNAGKTVHDLMREIALPAELRIGEFHGKTGWVVRAIREENAGRLHYQDGTTALYGVPRSAVNEDLVELAGADALADRARVPADAGRPLEAIHLLDIALGAEPGHAASLTVKKDALEQLLKASGGSNLSERCG